MVDVDNLLFSAFAAKLKMNRGAVDAGVAIPQSRQTVGMIVVNILLIANAHGAEFQKADHCRENFLPAQALLAESRLHRPADFWQRFAEGNHAIEFLFVANPAPA